MKRLAVLVLSLVLCFSMCIPAWGYTVPQTDGEAVADYASLLEYDEAKALEEKIDQIKSEYSYDVVIHTTSANISYEESQDYIDDFCSNNGYGADDPDSGIVFVYFEAGGLYGIKEIGLGTRVYDGEDLESLDTVVGSILSSYDYYGAFDKYVDEVYAYLKSSPVAKELKKSDEETSFIPLEPYNPLSPGAEGLQPNRGESVVDDADLLTSFEEQLLVSKIEEIIEQYSYDVVIHTTPTAGNAPSVEAYADDFYDYNGYGYGGNYDGMAFVLVMDSRDYYTSTHGKGIDVFNDSVINYLGDTIVNDLSNGDYYDAFAAYLNEVERYLYEYANGIVGDEYYDYYGYDDPSGNYNSGSKVKDILVKELGILAFAVVVAGIAVYIMKRRMNTAVAKREANAYIKKDSVNIGYQKDTFLYDTVTKRAKPKNNSSGGSSRPSGGGGFSGGSRTHTSSSGRTHGGGGGKF